MEKSESAREHDIRIWIAHSLRVWTIILNSVCLSIVMFMCYIANKCVSFLCGRTFKTFSSCFDQMLFSHLIRCDLFRWRERKTDRFFIEYFRFSFSDPLSLDILTLYMSRIICGCLLLLLLLHRQLSFQP